MKNKKNEKNKLCKPSFFESVSKGLDIDADMICRGFCAELRGKHRVELCGVKRIFTYSDILISFVTADGIFSVRGARLHCASFKRGAVIVEGDICSMGFEGEHGNELV